jgi:Fungal specific transcription factor domain/Fungal Zn(2)-Cys(6) binuclear cluster domain
MPSMRRGRSGCFTCRQKHRRCDETHPICNYCRNRKISCEWPKAAHAFVNFSAESGLHSKNGHKVSFDSTKSNMASHKNEGVAIHMEPSGTGEREATVDSLRGQINTPGRGDTVSTNHRGSQRVVPMNDSRSNNDKDNTEQATNSEGFQPGSAKNSEASEREPQLGTNHESYRAVTVNGHDRVDTETDTIMNTINENDTTQVNASRTGSITSSQRNSHPHTKYNVSEGSVLDQSSPFARSNHFNIILQHQSPAASAIQVATPSSDFESPFAGSPHDSQASLLGSSSILSSSNDGSELVPGISFSPADIAYQQSSGEPSEHDPTSPYSLLHNIFADYMVVRAGATTNNLPVTGDTSGPSRALSPQAEPSEKDLDDTAKCILLQNYINEVGPWLDMFDQKKHFTVQVPTMANDSLALFYAILAISSRQKERVESGYSSDITYRLYALSLHYLAPLINQPGDIATVTTCVVLCVFEMIISSPKNWRDHLTGCATLFKSMNINGFSESLPKALFWCFARMDIAHAVIGEQSTVCPCEDWIPRGYSAQDARRLFLESGTADMYANYSVYLCARVINLIASTDRNYNVQWQILWDELEEWRTNRPKEMLPVFSSLGRETEGDLGFAASFPRILYSNGPAVSGNQLYHMAHILMVQNKPRIFKIGPQTKSLIWHAKQICSISLFNFDHGCWNNALQPLWIAGQLMSSKSERKSISNILKKIDSTTGWSMKGRLHDLELIWKSDDDNEIG